MESNWGIRITGRLMKHKPWPVDCNNNYSEPGLYEREEIYGISGKAVKETLLYFEKCGGDVNGMIELLNNHAINRNFRVTNETLLDDSRWYTNEFYFYFIMFTKELMNNYDWRFVSANKEELSKYHKIYEIGLLRFHPFNTDNCDVTNSIPYSIIKYYSQKRSISPISFIGSIAW